MKKHVKKRPLDPGAGDIPGFQKVCKLGKGLVLILAGENSSGKRVGHVQVCAQARFIFLKEAVTVQAVQVIFQKKGILTNGIVKQIPGRMQEENYGRDLQVKQYWKLPTGSPHFGWQKPMGSCL